MTRRSLFRLSATTRSTKRLNRESLPGTRLTRVCSPEGDPMTSFVASLARSQRAHCRAVAIAAPPASEPQLLPRLALLTAMFLALLLYVGGPASATDIGYRGLGVQGGAVAPSNWDTGYGVGVHVDLGEMTHGLFLQPSANYWQASGTDSFLGLNFDRDMSNLALGADVLWYPSGERQGWYVGGGAYLNRLEYDIYGATLTDNRLGANAIGGYDFAFAGSAAFVEGRYHVVSGFNTVQVGLGLRFGG